jgi:hypothetical protein
MSTPRYRSILRTLLGAILQSGLNDRDLAYLSDELRRGRLPDELAYLVDRNIDHFRSKSTGGTGDQYVKVAEAKIKQKRISKQSVSNIIRSIDDVSDPIPVTRSLHDILLNFFDRASPRKAEQLLQILDSTGGTDPFLKGISDTRR